MVDLTVSAVAGIIAAIVVVIQQTVPSFAAWLAVSLIEKDATAVTWTVASRLVSQSHWPTIFRSDAAASRSVHRGVVALNWTLPILLTAVAVSAIIAPLGLTDVVSQSDDTVHTQAEYAADKSLLGDATPPREDNTYTRSCAFMKANACPETQTNVTLLASNSTLYSANITQDEHISPHLQDMYESGLSNMAPTVAGPFDIQSRFYFHVSDPDINHGELQRVPRYRKITNLIEDGSIKLIEGLIVDARNGGVGFRNHTVPRRMKYGATWTEDIFFVDSETSCVDLNLTLQFKTPEPVNAGLVSASDDGISLVDSGGFADLKQRPSVPMVNLTDPQANPDLWTRAYKTALMMTAYTAAIWNITNLPTYSGPNRTGEIAGHAFEFVNSDVGQAHNWNRSNLYLSYESLDPQSGFEFLLPEDVTLTVGTSENPTNLTSEDFYLLGEAGSADLRDFANISNLAVTCGMMIVPARLRTSEPLPLAYEPGLDVSSSIYSCASIPRASVKEVTFHYTGKDGLTGLRVDAIRPKKYDSNEVKPLWVAENLNITLADANPLWGLTSPQYINEVNVSTIRSERFYIPGLTSGMKTPFDGTGLYYNLPSLDFFAGAHKQFYNKPFTGGYNEYSADKSIALYRRWQTLTANASTAATVLDLAWTDMMANALVGTKSWLDNPAAPGAMMTVRPMRHSVGFQWKYGVLPLLAILFSVVLAIITAIAAIYARRGVRTIRHFMKQTSVGRLYTLRAHPDKTDMGAGTRAWIKSAGHARIEPPGLHNKDEGRQVMGHEPTSTERVPLKLPEKSKTY